MMEENQTTVREFILVGFSHIPYLKIPLFFSFSIIYGATLLGNLLIIIIISTDFHLQTPMYFFLSNISLLDILCPSVIVPKMLSDLVSRTRVISYHGCMAQLFFYILLTTVQCFLLSVMAFDRYVAICQPLHYHAIMSLEVCVRLAVGPWISGGLYSLIYTVATSQLTFCRSNVINHFFCDILQFLQMSCSDTSVNMITIFLGVVLVGVGNFAVVLGSYARIISTILKIVSREGRKKTFSTCSSHLMVVSLYYGTLIFMYFRTLASLSRPNVWMAALIYTIGTPILNPMIYSLKNKEIIGALRRKVGNMDCS
ncbi:olfactory receptor 10A7-like [Lissotriton helveticus]